MSRDNRRATYKKKKKKSSFLCCLRLLLEVSPRRSISGCGLVQVPVINLPPRSRLQLHRGYREGEEEPGRWNSVLEILLVPPVHTPGQDNQQKTQIRSTTSLRLPNTTLWMPNMVDNRQMNALEICQRKMERKILGITMRDRISNESLSQMASTTNVTQRANKLKWKWGGHIARMKDERWTHRATMWDPRTGDRHRGRPRKRWADFYTTQAGQQWSRIARSRGTWRTIGSRLQTKTDEETKQRYQVEISNRFAALATSDEAKKELDVNSVWDNIRDNIKIAAEQSIGYHETKKKKPWFDEDCSIAVDRRKQAKLKFLQDPIEENRENYFNERREASRTLRNKKRLLEGKTE
ncbi:hypothetical protein ANN_09218 [Periplaneta americana]|uniref:Uncharacterized protein n=1 Tax=Periplaneta americana TaxID=6978 RepID=A0ABQ8TM74_PERAM|nr:hypothetical protein ANN_09218 [Periplaneta americana]